MKAIVAMDPNRVIGYKGEIPWYIPDDFKWFKRVTMGMSPAEAIESIGCKNVAPVRTMGGYLVMGHTTFAKVGSLPGRFTFIITNDPEKLKIPGTNTCQYCTVGDVIHLSQLSDVWHNTWVVGGAKTYQAFLPQCDQIFVTHIADDYEGDTYMPEFESLFSDYETLKEDKDFTIVNYWRTLIDL